MASEPRIGFSRAFFRSYPHRRSFSIPQFHRFLTWEFRYGFHGETLLISQFLVCVLFLMSNSIEFCCWTRRLLLQVIEEDWYCILFSYLHWSFYYGDYILLDCDSSWCVDMASTSGTYNNTTSHSVGFTPFTIDIRHPFYIHSSDNLGSLLVAIPFSGTGFMTWRSSMLTSLLAKTKLSLIDGRIARPPPESPYFPYWKYVMT